MAKYSITFKKSVTKDLLSIPSNDIKHILEKIDALAEDPRSVGCIKLSTQERYRVRQGLYRIVYGIRDEELIIHVVKVAHKSSVYRNN